MNTNTSAHNDTLPLLLIEAIEQDSSPILVITTDPLEAQRLPALIRQIDPARNNCFQLPSWETLPYDRFSPHADLTSERLSGLLRCTTTSSGCLFVAANTLLYRLMPKTYLESRAHHYAKGMQINLTQLITTLTHSGYNSVNAVYEHGDFSNRGSILDIFPMGSKQPIRLDFFDNEIESIRLFDSETQCSLRQIDSFSILPAEEYPLDEDGISHFRQAWRETFSGNPMDAPVYQNISEKRSAPGAEYYLPLFYNKLDTLFDYLPKNTRIILTPEAKASFKKSYDSLCKRYESLRYDQQHPLCKPSSVAMNEIELASKLDSFNVTQLKSSPESNLPDIKIDHRNQNPLKGFTDFLSEKKAQKVIVCAETAGRKTVLIDLLRENHLHAVDGRSWQEAHTCDDKLVVVAAAFQAAFEIDSNIYITEQELFGSKQAQLQREDSQKKAIDPNTLIRNLVELNVGDPVVHRQHGIAHYKGLTSLTTDGIEAEYLLLHYSNDDKLYVPVTALHLITRYLGADAEHTPLSRLGSGSWDLATEKAKNAFAISQQNSWSLTANARTAKALPLTHPMLSSYSFAPPSPSPKPRTNAKPSMPSFRTWPHTKPWTA